MSPLNLSTLLVLVKPEGLAAKAAVQFPENTKYCHYGESGATSTNRLNLSEAPRKAYLALSLDPGPKDLSKGFVFGSDSETCDVLLAQDKTSGISGNHFSLNVNCHSGNSLITCLTTSGTGIHIWSESDRIWKLYLQAARVEVEPDTTTTIKISEKMKLLIQSPARHGTQPTYSRNLQKYFTKCQAAVPEMSHIRLYDPEQTPLLISRTRGLTGRQYITTSTIVGDKVVLCKVKGHQDWTDGSKTFTITRFRNTKSKWQEHARTKLTFLRALRHRHIITPEDIVTDRTEWMPVSLHQPQETLAERNLMQPLTAADAGQVLAQVFEGLRYLHENGIIHGCVCPGSILIEHSSPWSIKLTDIGLYPYVEFEDQEERALYASQKDGSTSKPVPVWDTWSAGVIGLELLSSDGLPPRPTKPNYTQRGWVIRVANRAIAFRNAEKPSPEGNKEAALFLTRVLEVELLDRLTAEKCLQDTWLKHWRMPASDDEEVLEEVTVEEKGSDEVTETEDPRSSISKGKQPLRARRSSVTSPGHQPRRPSITPRSPISKGKQPLHARRPSITSPGRQPRRPSKTPQDSPLIGSRHNTVEPSVGNEYNDVSGFEGSGSQK